MWIKTQTQNINNTNDPQKKYRLGTVISTQRKDSRMMFIYSKCLLELSNRLNSGKTINSLRVCRSSYNSIKLFVNFKASLSGTIKAVKFTYLPDVILNHINTYEEDFLPHNVML